MPSEYRCWCPDDGDEDGAQRITTNNGPRAAAELFVERNWQDLDGAEHVTVHVEDAHGYATSWSVRVTQSPNFDATQLLHHKPSPKEKTDAG